MPNIDDLMQRIDSLTRSEGYVALMLIYEGILFVFFTENAFTGTIYGIAIPVGILALGVLLEFIFTKTIFKKENLKPLCMALFFGILSILAMVYTKNLSIFVTYGIAVLLIVDGILGILNLIHYRKLQDKLTEVKRKGKEKSDELVTHEYDDAAFGGIVDTRNYILKPLDVAREKTGKYHNASLILSLIGIFMGVSLFIAHVQFGFLMLKVSGVFLLYIGVKNLIIVIRTWKKNKDIRT